jgi:phage FluMu protein Com
LTYPAFQMFVEYHCPECDVQELDPCIVPKMKCPKCGHLMECREEFEGGERDE